jgi:hypothetical protein
MSPGRWVKITRQGRTDWGTCPVCGTMIGINRTLPGGVGGRLRGLGPRTTLRHCGVRWRTGIRINRGSMREEQTWGRFGRWAR